MNPHTGHIKLNFSSIDAMEETCSLDVADQVADQDVLLSYDDIGALLGRTGERARQTEATGRTTLAEVLAGLRAAQT